MESFPFNFLECTKELTTDLTVEADTGVKVETSTIEEFAMDVEEENEFNEMKVALRDAAQRLEMSIYKSLVKEVYGEESGNLLRPFHMIPMQKKDASCCRFSQESNLLAVGTSTGTIEVYNSKNGRLSYMLDVGRKGQQKWACTSLSFRMTASPDLTKNILVSCGSPSSRSSFYCRRELFVLSGPMKSLDNWLLIVEDVQGQIHHWHATSDKHLGVIKEEDNEIYAVDFHASGAKFATSGADFKVRIYDGISRNRLQTFSKGNGVNTAGHSNRIFAVKWHPTDLNIVLSGGWDNTTQIWDCRVGTSVRSIYGTHIYGDALDIQAGSDRVLTGSWRRTNQLQEWDYGTGQLIENIPWPPHKEAMEPCRLYTAAYGQGVSKNLIAAGGSGTNEACLFTADTRQLIGRFPTLDNAVFGVSFSPDGTLLAILTTGAVYLVSMATLLSITRTET